MAASDTKRERRRKALPKLRVPIAPPGFRHPSKKDYKRDKKVEDLDKDPHDDFYRHDCSCGLCRGAGDGDAKEDLLFLLSRLNIISAGSRRVASYG